MYETRKAPLCKSGSWNFAFFDKWAMRGAHRPATFKTRQEPRHDIDWNAAIAQDNAHHSSSAAQGLILFSMRPKNDKLVTFVFNLRRSWLNDELPLFRRIRFLWCILQYVSTGWSAIPCPINKLDIFLLVNSSDRKDIADIVKAINTFARFNYTFLRGLSKFIRKPVFFWVDVGAYT